MKLKQLLLFTLCITSFACNTESINKPDNEEETPTTSKRVKEAIGYIKGVEIVKQIFTYSDNKLSNITEYQKSGSDWIEINTEEYTYNGSSITCELTSGSYMGNKTIYQTDNNNISTISNIEDGYIFSGYDDIIFSNNLISSYIFYEGTVDETWYSKSNCQYDGDKIIKIDEEAKSSTETSWIPDVTTTFSYNNNKLTGWVFDYIDDNEFDEKIQYEYTNEFITKTTENSWNVDLNDWVKQADINYSYDVDGYLIDQSVTEYDPNYYEYTSNHLFDYIYTFETNENFDQIKYTYEEGESNNYILLYPEFLAHKTPNPYVKF